MNKIILTLLMFVMISTTTLMGCTASNDKDTSELEIIDDQAIMPAETIVMSDNVLVINITEDSDEAEIAENMLGEKKSSPAFQFNGHVTLSITAIIVIISIVYINKKEE